MAQGEMVDNLANWNSCPLGPLENAVRPLGNVIVDLGFAKIKNGKFREWQRFLQIRNSYLGQRTVSAGFFLTKLVDLLQTLKTFWTSLKLEKLIKEHSNYCQFSIAKNESFTLDSEGSALKL